MLIVFQVYLLLAEAGFEPLILCILLVPPPWNFLCSYWLVSALHLSATGPLVLGERDNHYTTETCLLAASRNL